MHDHTGKKGGVSIYPFLGVNSTTDEQPIEEYL